MTKREIMDKTILEITLNENSGNPAIVKIAQLGLNDVANIGLDKIFVMTWGGEFVEAYPDLSVAFARLAALQKCAESDWEKGFDQSHSDFNTVAKAFLNGVTS